MDADSDQGWKLVKTAGLTANSIIIGVILNQNLIKEVVAQYKVNFFKIKEPDGAALMILSHWEAKSGTDGLAPVALINKRMELQGPGIHVG